MAGRTLIGAPPPRGQQLEDHYFGGIPERIQACIAEVEHELYKLGVPIVTRHNEVAPSPVRDGAASSRRPTSRVDHNQLVMATLRTRRAAPRPAGAAAREAVRRHQRLRQALQLVAWPIAADNAELDGFNLLKPGKTPHQNIRFLVFLAAVLKGVHKHAGLLRAGIATSGNEHRLGANEAPPAIISVFMGDDAHAASSRTSPRARTAAKAPSRQLIKLGVAQAAGDREGQHRPQPHVAVRLHRATSSSSAPSARRSRSPSRSCCSTRPSPRRSARSPSSSRESSRRRRTSTTRCSKVVREAFKETRAGPLRGQQLLGGVGEGSREARPARTCAARPKRSTQLDDASSRAALLTKLGILTKAELESRYHVRLERYVKDMLIEMHTLREMVDTMVLPAASRTRGTLADGGGAGEGGRHQGRAADRRGERGRRADRALRERRDALAKVIEKAEAHARRPRRKQAKLLTATAPTRWPPCARRATRSSSWWPTSAGRCRSTGRCFSRCEQPERLIGEALEGHAGTRRRALRAYGLAGATLGAPNSGASSGMRDTRGPPHPDRVHVPSIRLLLCAASMALPALAMHNRPSRRSRTESSCSRTASR